MVSAIILTVIVRTAPVGPSLDPTPGRRGGMGLVDSPAAREAIDKALTDCRSSSAMCLRHSPDLVGRARLCRSRPNRLADIGANRGPLAWRQTPLAQARPPWHAPCETLRMMRTSFRLHSNAVLSSLAHAVQRTSRRGSTVRTSPVVIFSRRQSRQQGHTFIPTTRRMAGSSAHGPVESAS